MQRSSIRSIDKQVQTGYSSFKKKVGEILCYSVDYANRNHRTVMDWNVFGKKIAINRKTITQKSQQDEKTFRDNIQRLKRTIIIIYMR